ncbi:hypothetical protein YPPY66_3125, partial [Yersinia pestis PY-66]
MEEIKEKYSVTFIFSLLIE